MSSERQEYNFESPWWGEHVFRYNWVISLLKGNETILDIASGNGYGTWLLSQKTCGDVFGVDIDEKAIHQSKQNFKANNLVYLTKNGTSTNFDSLKFDCIVSLETIEHTKDYKDLLAEFKRILKADGVLYLSTPNRLISSPDGIIKNPFHTQEWSPNELEKLLKIFFTNVKLYGQQNNRYSKEKKPLSYYVERLLYMRGIRKLPVSLQNSIMKFFGHPGIYPVPDEFGLVSDPILINTCPSLIACCFN